MKYFCFLIFVFSSMAYGAGLTKASFLKAMGFVQGEYFPADENRNCDGGKFVIRETQKNGLTLASDIRFSIYGLGKDSVTRSERSCQWIASSTIKGKKIQWHEIEYCKDEPARKRSVNVTFFEGGFTYNRKVMEGKKKIFEENCKLKLVKAI